MKNRFLVRVISIVVSISMAIGCSGTNSSEDYKPGSIHVNKTSLVMKIGTREQLTAMLTPAVANTPTLEWISSNTDIATVTNGLVEAVAPGDATITVKYQNISTTIAVNVEQKATEVSGVLYDKKLSNEDAIPELVLNGVGQYTSEGLNVTGKTNVAKLNKFYALAERVIKYHVKLSDDAKATFRSEGGDFIATIDVPNKQISIATTPVTQKTVDFLKGNGEYIVEIYHIYQQAKVRIVDVQTNQEAEISVINDGQGGCGEGALQPGFSVGMQWDYYCFGLAQGSSMLVKQITVCALKSKVRLMMYGDSITQPEGYFPAKDFAQSWTQRIISHLNGNAICSGRGGGTINEVMTYIKNELPYIQTDYVMVTIGTNGGNTEANLSELINYIKDQGAIPILNNTPSNESGTQIEINQVIDQVRKKFGINGCMFDEATSIAGDGKEVDKSMMYWEDYTGSYGWQIYHHPNEKGGQAMFERSLTDVPEIYK